MINKIKNDKLIEHFFTSFRNLKLSEILDMNEDTINMYADIGLHLTNNKFKNSPEIDINMFKLLKNNSLNTEYV